MERLFAERHSPLRYPVVGVSTYLLENACYLAFLKYVDQWYLISYYEAGLIAFIFNFTGHTQFTFRGQKHRSFVRLLAYESFFKLIMLAIRGYVLVLTVEYGGLPPAVGPVITTLALLATYTFTSWVFAGLNPKQAWILVWQNLCLVIRTITGLFRSL